MNIRIISLDIIIWPLQFLDARYHMIIMSCWLFLACFLYFHFLDCYQIRPYISVYVCLMFSKHCGFWSPASWPTDVHCALHFVLSCQEELEYLVKESDDICIKPKWVNEKSVDFMTNLIEEIEVLNCKLDTINIELGWSGNRIQFDIEYCCFFEWYACNP